MNKTIDALKLAEEALLRVEQNAEECMGDDGMVMVVPLDLYNELAESIPAIRAARAQEQEPYTPYGFCPICGRAGVSRERGLNGSDTCVTGHRYASSEAIPDTPQPVKQEPVAWINEDELPEHYPYEEMFNASTIIDGVRMFPNVKMSDRSMFYGLTKDHTWLSVTESQFNKLKPEKRMKCYLTPVDAKAIRAEALEQAAKVCEQGTGDAVQTDVLKALWKERERIAEVIRGLK